MPNEPNQYETYVPPEQSGDDDQLKADALYVRQNLDVVKDVMQWLEASVEAYRGVDQVQGINPASDANAVKTAVLLCQGMHTDFDAKLTEFKERFSDHIIAAETTIASD